MGSLFGSQHVVDAKSMYDSLSKEVPGSKQDRRSGVDLAIIRESMGQSGTVVRWVPHQLMLVDCMTKSDVAKGNYALTSTLKTGYMRLVVESTEMSKRKGTKSGLSRSRGASQKRLESEVQGSSGLQRETAVVAPVFSEQDLQKVGSADRFAFQ